MKKLKIVLQSNVFYVLLFFICLIYCFIYLKVVSHSSKYSEVDNNFDVKIIDYEINPDKIRLELEGKEKLIGSFFFKNVDSYEYYYNQIGYGTKLNVNGLLVANDNNTIPFIFNYNKYLYNHGIYYSLKNIKINSISNNDISFIDKVRNIVIKRINNVDNTGYLKAFIIGNKDGISDTIYKDYQSIGIAHLFALSGMHISLICLIIMKFLKRLNILTKYFIIDFILIFYGFLVSFPASIKRCIIFFVSNSFNKIFGLELVPLKVMIITSFIIIMFDPFIIYDTGFLYSVLTVSGIILSNKFIKSSNKFMMSLKLSFVTFLFSLPVTLYSFYSINLLSILYNLVYIPFVSFIVYPLSLLSFIFPFINSIFVFSISVLERSVSFLSTINVFTFYLNFNILEIIVFYLLLLLFIFKSYYFLIGSIFFIVFDILLPFFDGNNYVYFFDVGQGDSSLIVNHNMKDVVLIDSGGLISYDGLSSHRISNNIITFFKAKGIKKIDYLILTHGDFDHMGEATNLVNNFKVEKVIFNCGPYNDLENELIKVLNNKKIPYYSCISELNINNNKLYFLQTKEYDNENDFSNVIYTELNGYKFMFMGDASVTTEKEILDKYNLPDIDVLKVGHHGSKTSSGKNFIDEISPKYSIISVGKNNRYGHPNKEVLDNLNDSKIYRTDEDGSIMFKIKNNKLKIDTCSP